MIFWLKLGLKTTLELLHYSPFFTYFESRFLWVRSSFQMISKEIEFVLLPSPSPHGSSIPFSRILHSLLKSSTFPPKTLQIHPIIELVWQLGNNSRRILENVELNMKGNFTTAFGPFCPSHSFLAQDSVSRSSSRFFVILANLSIKTYIS